MMAHERAQIPPAAGHILAVNAGALRKCGLRVVLSIARAASAHAVLICLRVCRSRRSMAGR